MMVFRVVFFWVDDYQKFFVVKKICEKIFCIEIMFNFAGHLKMVNNKFCEVEMFVRLKDNDGFEFTKLLNIKIK